MAHFDLEEQEQLDQIKHFWKQYGSVISWALIVLLASYSGWNGWQYWQQKRALQASAMYEEVERVVASGDAARIDRAMADMKDKFGATLQAQQAALMVAKVQATAGRADAAQATLQWVADAASDPGYRALARLRLAGLLIDAKSYDAALQQLAGDMPGEFTGLAADRRADIYLLQGKKTEAGAEYLKAWRALDPADSYRSVIDVKLASLGIDPKAGENK